MSKQYIILFTTIQYIQEFIHIFIYIYAYIINTYMTSSYYPASPRTSKFNVTFLIIDTASDERTYELHSYALRMSLLKMYFH